MVTLANDSSLQTQEDLLSSRPAWTTPGVLDQPGIHSETLSQKTTKKITLRNTVITNLITSTVNLLNIKF